MTTLLRDFAVGTFAPYLRTLSGLLDKAAGHEKASVLADARLTPDMYPLRRQVQLACHHARSGVTALTTGSAIPTTEGPPDDDLAALQTLLATTVAWLEGVNADFDETRIIHQSLQGNRTLALPAPRYLREWAFAHFFFHVVTAYDILRVEGVDVGKRLFVSHVADAITTR